MSYPLAVVAMDILAGGEAGLPHFDQAIYDGLSLVKSNKSITKETFVSFVNALIESTESESSKVDLLILGSEAQNGDVLAGEEVNTYKSITYFDSLYDAINVAGERLSSNQSQVVVVAALHEAPSALPPPGNESSDAELTSTLLTSTLLFDVNVTKNQRYSGMNAGAAIVLTREGDASAPPYAYLLGTASGDSVASASALCLEQSGVDASEVEYIDTITDNVPDPSQALLGLVEVYGQASKQLNCGLGSISTCLGQCGHVSGLASVIKSALSLHHRYIPAVSEWDAPAQPEVWENSPFYVATESTAWFENKALGIRKAAVSLSTGDTATHILLSENKAEKERPSHYFSRVSWCFYPVTGNNIDDLKVSLDLLKEQINVSADLKGLASDYFASFQASRATAEYTLVILGENAEVLQKEIELMLAGLQSSFESLTERKTPKGSFFTPTPVGTDAEVAFVYPGIGAPYVDFGRDLFHLFPSAYSSLDAMSRDAGKSVKQELLYPRSRHRMDAKQKKQVEKELKINLHKISECGVGMGYLLTKVFRDQFNFQPNAGVGYSMGEISMYVALDAWTDPGCLSEPLADHPTFKHNITGELFALKEYWGLAKSQQSGTQLWNTYSLRGDPKEVAQVVEQEEKVFLTIINTPDNMLIGGDPESCQRVVKTLGTRAMSLELASAIHSAPAKAEYDRIVDLYNIDVNERSSVRYYSTSVYKPVPHRSKAIAHSIAKSFTEQVDFPRLIDQMVDSGVRVFVEMGADRSCSTWIDKILKHNHSGMSHVCVPVNARGTEDRITIVRALAKLVSHQVDIDISSLFHPAA